MTTIPVTGVQRLRVDEVLLAGETPDGPALVSIEALVVDAAGLTIVGPRPGAERLVPWAEISGFDGLRGATLPDGAPATALVLSVRGRTLKFLLPYTAVPASALAELDRAIGARVGAPGSAPSGPAPEVSPSRHLSADRGEPVRRSSPTPHMPPTNELQPLVDASTKAAGLAAVPVPPVAVSLPEPGGAPAHPVPPRAVPLPKTTPPAGQAVRPAPAAVAPVAPRAVPGSGGMAEDEEALPTESPDDDMVVARPAPSKRERRRLGVRQSQTVVAKPLLAAEDFEYSSDPSLPRGGPAPGAVIEVTRHHRGARRAAALFVALVFVATGAGVWYYTKDHAHAAPAPNPARDLGIANSTLIGNPTQDTRLASSQAPDLPGWSAKPLSASNPFAMGASSSDAAARASAATAGSLAACLGVSPTTLSAATGAGGSDTADRSAVVGSRLYGAPAGDPSTAFSSTEVMASSSVVQADAKVFQNASLFATCYEPYAQKMLPYVASTLGPGQRLDAATVQPMAVPAPPAGSGVHAYGFQVTILGHSGSNGFTVVLDEVAVLGGRVQTTLAMDSDVVFPIDAQASLVQAAEARVHAVVDK